MTTFASPSLTLAFPVILADVASDQPDELPCKGLLEDSGDWDLRENVATYLRTEKRADCLTRSIDGWIMDCVEIFRVCEFRFQNVAGRARGIDFRRCWEKEF